MLSIILGAVAAAGSIVGGAVKSHNSRVAAQRQQAELDRQKAENEAIYNRRYYEDVTMRADNQRIINQARAALQRNSTAAAGQAAVMGATNATSAAMKEANNAALSNVVSGIAASAAQQKLNAEDNYINRNTAIGNMQNNVDMQRTEAANAAIDGAVDGMNSLAEAYISGKSDVESNKASNDFSKKASNGFVSSSGNVVGNHAVQKHLSAADVKAQQQLNPAKRLAEMVNKRNTENTRSLASALFK